MVFLLVTSGYVSWQLSLWVSFVEALNQDSACNDPCVELFSTGKWHHWVVSACYAWHLTRKRFENPCIHSAQGEKKDGTTRSSQRRPSVTRLPRPSSACRISPDLSHEGYGTQRSITIFHWYHEVDRLRHVSEHFFGNKAGSFACFESLKLRRWC